MKARDILVDYVNFNEAEGHSEDAEAMRNLDQLLADMVQAINDGYSNDEGHELLGRAKLLGYEGSK